MGSGMTPLAPEIGCPPASNMSEKLTAKRAPFGQSEVEFVMCASCVAPRAAALASAETGGANAAPDARICRREIRAVFVCIFESLVGRTMGLMVVAALS